MQWVGEDSSVEVPMLCWIFVNKLILVDWSDSCVVSLVIEKGTIDDDPVVDSVRFSILVSVVVNSVEWCFVVFDDDANGE